MRGCERVDYKIGIIGPQDLVAQTVELMALHPLLCPLPLPYEYETFTSNSVEQGLDEHVQAFLFTGYLPYSMALDAGLTTPAFYYQLADTSLVSLLFRLQVHDGIDAKRMSFDTLQQAEIYEVYKQLGLENTSLHINPLGLERFDLKQYVEFHADLFNSGETQGAITAVNSVYRKLLEEGVTACRVVPTPAAMRRTLKLVATFVDGEIARDSRLMIQIFRPGSQLEEGKFQLLCDRLKEYAKSHHGAFMVTHDQEIFILINQGIFKKYSNLYESIPEVGRIQQEISAPLYVGIGMGPTAHQAESNCRDALRLSKTRGDSNAYIINAEQEVIGPLRLSDEKTVSFLLRSRSPYLQELAQRTNLSIPTLTKVAHLVEDVSDNHLTSKTIQDGLRVTLRTANRIIGRLVAAGVAEEVGVEGRVGRGRPRRVYKISLNENEQGQTLKTYSS